MYPSIKNKTPGSNSINYSETRSIINSVSKGSAGSSRKPWFTTQTDFTTGSGKKIGDHLTGRTISTTAAVSADGVATPINITPTLTRPMPSPKILDTLFGVYSQDSVGYKIQEDMEDLCPDPIGMDDICTN
jgi:hypothetical protein